MSGEADKKQRLLIVDDSKVIRVTARKILQNHFETVEAVDGENAWELLNNAGPFNLVVSDLTMPTLDGFGLPERIRSAHIPQIKDLPVIIITGANDSESTKERATRAGATDFIGKPFDSVHLLARTQAHASALTSTRTLTEEKIVSEEQALTDPLTGMANEAAFMDHSYQQLSYAVRHKTSLAVFRVEIDDFGDLFKQHGKDISESIIQSVATVLQSGIRQEDMAARVGTARFALLLPGMNNTGIRNLADRINRDISARIFKQGENRVRYTVSIGVAAPEIRRDTRFDELLSIADSRLVYAMSQGGNQVVCKESGAAVQPSQPGTPGDKAPGLLDETITEMINQSLEAGIQIEEINLATAGSVTENEEIVLDEVPVIESRSKQEPDDLPSMFAGPVPELTTAATADSTEAFKRTHAAAAHPAFIDGPGAGEEETIIITAPFGHHYAPDETPPAGDQPEKAPLEDVTPDHDSAAETRNSTSNNRYTQALQVASNDTRTEDTFESIIQPRPGMFRRLLSSLASLFRRSRKSG